MNNETIIHFLLEGGIGDCLLANRFVPAIKQAYPNSIIRLFINNDLNDSTPNFIHNCWPDNFENWQHVERESKNHIVNSQFGEETYNAHLDNLTEESKKQLFRCDLFFNGHIDSLSWIHDIPNWRNYYYHFPPPQINLAEYISPHIAKENLSDKKYILLHLMARPDGDHEIEDWYRDKLISDLNKSLPEDYYIYIVCQKQFFDKYNNVQSEKIKLIDGNLIDIFYMAQHCQQFLGIDSGIRYLPLHFGKPTWVLSKYCNSPGNIAHSHLIRWLIFPQYVLPRHHNTKEVVARITNTILHPAYSLYPTLSPPIENHIVERQFK